jgi:DNA-binding Xre family transcriptional regulator
VASDWLRAIGVNVLMARTKAGKAQTQLGVSPTTVAKLEDGGGGTLLTVEKIARALKVQPSTLVVTSPVRDRGEHAVFLAEVTRMLENPARNRVIHFLASVKDEHVDDFERHVKTWKEPEEATRARGRLQPPRAR